MSSDLDDPLGLGDLDPDDPRAASQQIAAKLRAVILTGKLKPTEGLPSQPRLAEHYGVARETIKVALRTLHNERLIVTRQGSGSYVRAQTERPVGLRPHMDSAFAAPHVSIDFAGFSGETLQNTLMEPLDKVRAGQLTPESLKIRLMSCDTSAPMALPRRPGATGTDADISERAERISRRAADSIAEAVHELSDLGLVKSTSVEVRVHQLAPTFKMYVLNDVEVFFGFYPVVEHSIRLDGDSVDVFDLLGKDATLFHFSSEEDPDTSNGPQYVREARRWFDSVWNSIAREERL